MYWFVGIISYNFPGWQACKKGKTLLPAVFQVKNVQISARKFWLELLGYQDIFALLKDAG